MKKTYSWMSVFVLSITLITSSLVIPQTFAALPQEEEFVFEAHISEDELLVKNEKDFDLIQISGINTYTMEVGKPQLPVKILTVALPPNQKIESVDILEDTVKQIPGSFIPLPVQKPQKFSSKNPTFTQPDSLAYRSSQPYPHKRVEVLSTGSLGGIDVAYVKLNLVQYTADQKTIEYHSIKFQLNLRKKDSQDLKDLSKASIDYSKRSQKSRSMWKTFLKKAVNNVEDIAYHPGLSTTGVPKKAPSGKVWLKEDQDLNTIDYLIVTSQDLIDSGCFQPLLQSKKAKGLKTKITSVSWIKNNYSGRDTQEKIRNYIKWLYSEKGLTWVLLGGDTTIVPHRMTYLPQVDFDYQIPTDLYYSDLDGDWDANDNNVFGQVADNIDFYPDVFVGRAPVEDQQAAETFVEKILLYEAGETLRQNRKGIPQHGIPAVPYYDRNYITKALFLGANDFQDAGGTAKDYIDENYVPEEFKPVTKLYEREIPSYAQETLDLIHKGYHVVNHIDHAWWDLLVAGGEVITTADIDSLQNIYLSIFYSIGCWPAAIDYDAIAEHWINNPVGGGVAFLGNTRYGLNPISDQMLDPEFYHTVFEENILPLGQALADSKIPFIGEAHTNDGMRYCLYELLLLGDPEMEIQNWKIPTIKNTNIDVDDSALGDGDGFLDPGETVDMILTLKALNFDSNQTQAVLISNNDPYVTIIKNKADYGTIPEGQEKANNQDPYKIKIDANCPRGHKVDVSLLVKSLGYSEKISLDLKVFKPWPFMTTSAILGSAVTADINQDGYLEIIFGSNDKKVYCLNHFGEILWKYDAGAEVRSTPVVADINSDGMLEIVFASRDYNWDKSQIICLDRNGQLLWEYGQQEVFMWESLAVSDLDHDGSSEIIISVIDNGNRKLICLDKDGQVIWECPTAYESEAPAAIVDLDNDGFEEIILSSMWYLYVIDKDGNILWEKGAIGRLESSPAVADLDGNGNMEILVSSSSSKKVYCLDKNGQTLWEFQTQGEVVNTPAVADLNNDGSLEILFGAGYGDDRFYCLNKFGQLLWQYEVGKSMKGAPVVADLNGDGIYEIIFGEFEIIVLNRYGQLLWEYQIAGNVHGAPTIGDLDKDGQKEILIGSSILLGHMHCLATTGEDFVPGDSQPGVQSVPSMTFRYNNQRTGWYKD